MPTPTLVQTATPVSTPFSGSVVTRTYAVKPVWFKDRYGKRVRGTVLDTMNLGGKNCKGLKYQLSADGKLLRVTAPSSLHTLLGKNLVRVK